jgi:hypothetical protein
MMQFLMNIATQGTKQYTHFYNKSAGMESGRTDPLFWLHLAR